MGRFSLAAQQRKISFYTRHGHDVVAVYEDHESGRKGRDDRKAFDQMFRDAARGRFDVLAFWSLDRFSREGLAQVINYLRQLDECGVAFHSFTEENLNTESELVRDILLTVLAHLAKHEAERISRRTKAGLARVRKSGTQLGRPSKVDLSIYHFQEASRQLSLEGSPPSNREIARAVSRRIGKDISESTVRRCLKKIRAKEGA